MSNEGLRFVVHDVDADVVGWLVERGHHRVAAAPDLVLTSGEVPLDVRNALVVHIGSQAEPHARADIVLAQFRVNNDLGRVENLARRLKAVESSGARRWDDVTVAIDAAMDELASRPGHMPSVYFLRGDRLRCLGSRGYHQILDGFPVGRAVLGEVVQTGKARTVQNRRDVAEFAVAQDA